LLAKQEVDRLLGQTPARQANLVKKQFEERLEEYQSKIGLLELEKNNLASDSDYIDWYDQYMQDMERMIDTPREERLAVIKKYIEEIKIYYDEENLFHVIKLTFNVPIVNDKLIWNDKKNRSKSYKLRKGRKTKELYVKKM